MTTTTRHADLSTRPAGHARRSVTRRPFRMVIPGIVGLAIATACVVMSPSVVNAGLAASAGPTFPTAVTVGQTAVAASIELTNQNTPPNAADVNTVCNFGDAAPCPVGDPGITLIPSCGVLGSFSTCDPAGIDPGVLQISPTATGEAGTACAGMVFDVTLIDPVYGRLRFTPQGGQHVTLPGAGSLCRIGFTFDVLRVPTLDQDPGTVGLQTVQIVDNTQQSGVLLASARGTSNGLTVLRANPAISTVASASVVVGGQITDTAAVTGRVNPLPGATVTFNLFGVGDATCAGAPVFSSTVAINADGTATSAPYTTSAAGAHKWIASYSGDANNNPVTGVCSDTGETVIITPATPAITTLASPPVLIGGQLTDTAAVTARINPVPGATVTFNLYGAGDATCAAAPIFTSTVPINADGTATSGPYTVVLAGTYEWIATYNGDANNSPVSGTCSDTGETVTIALATPAISTVASPGVALSGVVTDTATVTGRVNPLPGATVTFNFYGAGDATCSAAPIFTSTVAINADGTATSAPFTPAAPGTYRWIATYSGDANNRPVSGVCGDTGESVTVTGPVASPPLPVTGTSVGGQLAIGSAVLAGGILLVLTSRRRRTLTGIWSDDRRYIVGR